MARAKPKDDSLGTGAVDAVAGEGTAQAEAVDPKIAEATSTHAEAAANVAELRSALAEAEATEVQARSELDALTAPPPPPRIAGPRVKLEETGEIVAVRPGEERERRLLLFHRNYEHVSDFLERWSEGDTEHTEEIWVYRRM